MILCCGEALIDMIPDGDGYRPHAGGAVHNTAVALGRLGVDCGMVTGLSTDGFGRMLEAGLAASDVATDLAIRSDRLTTLAFVELLAGKARYRFYDENSAGRMLEPGDMPTVPEATQALFFGGISLVFEPAAGAYAALARTEAARRVIMVDPNIRPAFIADAPAYRTRLSGLLGLADIVKVSDEDLDWLVPGGADIAAKVAQIAGPALIVVTEGDRGATACLADGRRISVPAHPARVADTVGAGDSFNAGLLAHLSGAGLLDKTALASIGTEPVRAALDYAARVAAITVSRPGADPPRAAEIDALP